MKVCFILQFCYCSMVWINHSQSLNNCIKPFSRQRSTYIPPALHLVIYNDFTSFAEMLIKDSSTSMHQRNLQTLVNEKFKVKSNLTVEIINDIFKLNHRSYNIKNNSDFQQINITTFLKLCPP